MAIALKKQKYAFLRLLIPSTDLHDVCRVLADHAFSPKSEPQTPSEKALRPFHDGADSPYTHSLQHLRTVCMAADVQPTKANWNVQLPADWHSETRRIYDTYRELEKSKSVLLEQKEVCLSGKQQLALFGDLPVDLQDIAECTFVHIRFGHMPKACYARLNALYDDNPNIAFFPSFFDETEVFGLYFTPRNIAEQIDAVFASLLFEPLEIPSLSGNVESVETQLTKSMDIVQDALSRLQQRETYFFEMEREKLRTLYAALTTADKLFALESYALSNTSVCILAGLLPQKNEAVARAAIQKISPGCRVEETVVRVRPETA